MCKYKHSLTKIETSYITTFLNGIKGAVKIIREGGLQIQGGS